MKKLISLSAIIMLGLVAFAQDTIPRPNDSSPMSPNKNWQKDSMGQREDRSKYDTSLEGRRRWQSDSVQRKQWSNDTSKARRWSNDSVMNRNNRQWNRDSGRMGARPNSDSAMKWNDNTDRNNNTDSLMSTPGQGQDSMMNNQKSMDDANKDGRNKQGMDESDNTTETLADRVMMKNDTMYMVKNGENTLLEKNYKLESGAIVMVDGSVKYPSGKTVQLKNGQFIALAATKEMDAKDKTKNKEMGAKYKNKEMKESGKTTKKYNKKSAKKPAGPKTTSDL